MTKKSLITCIMVLFHCGASGQSLSQGKTYKVPAEVSEKDARTLIKLKRAEDASADARADAAVSAEAFAAAVDQLDVDDEAHWTGSGSPDVNALKALGLDGLSARQRDALWSEYQPVNG